MKFVGSFLLLAGWSLILCALLLFPAQLPRSVFVAAGLAVQALGLALLLRAHRLYPREDLS
jgi:protein-S-isoprenylcysteine O-methyltransferase Ste14